VMFSEASDWMSTRSGRVETKKLEEIEEWSCGGRILERKKVRFTVTLSSPSSEIFCEEV
jgi:hypothetical protein